MIIRYLLIGFLCFPVMSSWSTAQQNQRVEHLSVAGGYFPEQWGNPFSSTSITRQPIWSAIFDPLTFVTTDGDLLPWLATGWERKSPTAWHVSLRPGVTFSNGAPFDATSVVAAIEYLISETGRATPVGRELGNLSGASLAGPLAIEIRISKPDPLLPFKLSLVRPVEVSQWRKENPDTYFMSPPGTGPYVVQDVRANRTRLTARSDSWRNAPADTLEYLVLLEPASRQAALATGQADIALTALSPDEFETLRAAGGQVFIDRIPAVVTLAFNTVRDAPFRDQRIREAIILAVDRQAIVDILLGGETVVANQPASRSTFGFNPDLPFRPHDPERARVLLREAGYPDGFAVAMEMPSGAVLYTDVFQKVAADLAQIGVQMTVRTVPQIAFLDRIQTGSWQGEAMAIPFFTPVADALYAMRQNSCLWHAAYYCDPEAVPMIEDALSEPDLDMRLTKTRAVMAHAYDTAQALFLYETVAFIGLGPRIKTFRADYGFIRYEDITFAHEN